MWTEIKHETNETKIRLAYRRGVARKRKRHHKNKRHKHVAKRLLKIENFNVYKHKRESYFFEMKQSQVDSFVDWALKKKNLKKFLTLIPRLKKLPQEDLPEELKKLATEASFKFTPDDAWIKHFPQQKKLARVL